VVVVVVRTMLLLLLLLWQQAGSSFDSCLQVERCRPQTGLTAPSRWVAVSTRWPATRRPIAARHNVFCHFFDVTFDCYYGGDVTMVNDCSIM